MSTESIPIKFYLAFRFSMQFHFLIFLFFSLSFSSSHFSELSTHIQVHAFQSRCYERTQWPVLSFIVISNVPIDPKGCWQSVGTNSQVILLLLFRLIVVQCAI